MEFNFSCMFSWREAFSASRPLGITSQAIRLSCRPNPLVCVAGFREAASRPWLDSGPQAHSALANLFQYRFKSSQLFRARIGKDFPNFGGVFPKDRRDQSFAFWCERHDADAPILRTLDPAYQ